MNSRPFRCNWVFKTGVMTSIYIFACGEFVKVGLSDDPFRRLGSVQTNCPHEVTMLFKEKIFRFNADAVETQAHLLLKGHHARGEWFQCTPETALTAVRTAIESHNVDGEVRVLEDELVQLNRRPDLKPECWEFIMPEESMG